MECCPTCGRLRPAAAVGTTGCAYDCGQHQAAKREAGSEEDNDVDDDQRKKACRRRPSKKPRCDSGQQDQKSYDERWADFSFPDELKVSKKMHVLTTEEPSLWRVLARRRWGHGSLDEELPDHVDAAFALEWRATSDARTRYRLRHTYCGDWMFDRYGLHSIALPQSNDSVIAMEYVAEDDVILVGFNNGSIQIWDVHSDALVATIALPPIPDGVRQVAGALATMFIHKYKIITGFHDGIAIHTVIKRTRRRGSVPVLDYSIEASAFLNCTFIWLIESLRSRSREIDLTL